MIFELSNNLKERALNLNFKISKLNPKNPKMNHLWIFETSGKGTYSQQQIL